MAPPRPSKPQERNCRPHPHWPHRRPRERRYRPRRRHRERPYRRARPRNGSENGRKGLPEPERTACGQDGKCEVWGPAGRKSREHSRAHEPRTEVGLRAPEVFSKPIPRTFRLRLLSPFVPLPTVGFPWRTWRRGVALAVVRHRWSCDMRTCANGSRSINHLHRPGEPGSESLGGSLSRECSSEACLLVPGVLGY